MKYSICMMVYKYTDSDILLFWSYIRNNMINDDNMFYMRMKSMIM